MSPLVILLALALSAISALAAPARYALEPDDSTVAFTWFFGSDPVTGRMPVSRADLILDFDSPRNSHVAVALLASRADAGHPLATPAMKAPKVLDTRSHPEIVFRSTSVTAIPGGARMVGEITMRGVTRPITLTAEIYRQRGTEAGDLSRLTVLLTGSLDRSDFGATGWSDMVGDEIRLRILARVRRTDG